MTERTTSVKQGGDLLSFFLEHLVCKWFLEPILVYSNRWHRVVTPWGIRLLSKATSNRLLLLLISLLIGAVLQDFLRKSLVPKLQMLLASDEASDITLSLWRHPLSLVSPFISLI